MRVICVSPYFHTVNKIWIYQSKSIFFKVFLSKRFRVLLIIHIDLCISYWVAINPNIITQKFIENFSASLDTVEWALFHLKNLPPNIRQMYLQYVYSIVIVLVFVLVKAISLQGVNIPLTTASSIWNDVINPAE